MTATVTRVRAGVYELHCGPERFTIARQYSAWTAWIGRTYAHGRSLKECTKAAQIRVLQVMNRAW